MRYSLVLLIGLLSISLSSAALAGTVLRWNDCPASGGADDETFACDTNDGFHHLVLMFDTPAELPAFIGFDALIQIDFAPDTISAWWINAPRLSASLEFDHPPYESGICSSPWQGQNYGYFQAGPGGSNSAFEQLYRARSVEPIELPGGTSYFGVELLISNVATAGVGALPGCLAGACIRVIDFTIKQSAGHPDHVLEGASARWQQGAPSCDPWGAKPPAPDEAQATDGSKRPGETAP